MSSDRGVNQSGGLLWRLIKLPISIISGSLGLLSGGIGLGLWMAGCVLSFSLSMIGLADSRCAGEPASHAPPVSPASEAMNFVAKFESEFGNKHPNFVSEGFIEALERSRSEGKLLFVYLQSPENPDTAGFCKGTLCWEGLWKFLNENFICWGGSVGANEGFKMSRSFKASRFPFCAVVKSADNHKVSLLQKFEGPTGPQEMLTALQSVLQDNASVLVTDTEEQENSTQNTEEQDTADQAVLEPDQANEQEMNEEQEHIEREAGEVERDPKEEEEIGEAGDKEPALALVKPHEEKSLVLEPEPEEGPDVTQVSVRLPNGERKGRRFDCNNTLQTVYDYVDSSGCLDVGSYTLVTFFPRILYGQDKLSSTLKELGLHPQAILFVELNS